MHSPDSGQWSSSFPSSPIKEQSPVHQPGQPGSKGSGHPHRHSGSGHSSKKSDLYGTPHWWPVASSANHVENDDMPEDMKSSKYSSLEQSDELETAVAQNQNQPSSSSTQNDSQPHQKPMAFVIDFNNDTADVKSDNGTYTLDEPRQSVDVCNGNNNDGASISSSGGAGDQEWIYKWANEAAGRLNSSSLYEEESLDNNNETNNETKEILSETEKIVESMQSRVQRSKSNLSPENVKKYPASMIKFNRAFNIRRTLNTNAASSPTYDSDHCSNKSTTDPGDSGHFSRSDGGRFSLRMSRGQRRNFNSASDPEGHSTTITPIRAQHGISPRHSLASESNHRNSSPHPSATLSNKFTPLKPPINNSNTISSLKQQKSIRSNSTMSSRDIELENWRRRKSYDPMRASGMCQRLTGSNSNVSGGESKEAPGLNNSPLDHRKNSSSSLTRKKDYLKRSSVKPSNPPPSPTSASTSSIINKLPQPCCGNPRSLENTSSYSCGEDHPRVFSDYKTHQCQVQGHLEQRKFEALDTLVISTIHSLSTKVRNLSLNLLKKIQPMHGEEENGALLEEMITQLTELSQSQTCNNTTSKELSGTLRNIKKIEQVVLVLDRVLCDQSSSETED